ncbi:MULTISPECIES: hypothetical protein [unclassified Butyrivibrio]|uniref:hypothetical protein n=1 Tax=unclassified Butyrivibrio TaxID=2639466 RepID=UPI0012DFBC73|nr:MULTISPECIES: hypothetical protein [unclassified Butyrivibrio]
MGRTRRVVERSGNTLNLNVYVREGMSDEEELEIFKKLNDEQAVKEYEKFLFG